MPNPADEDAFSGADTASLDKTRRDDPAAFGLETGTLVGRYVIVDRLGAGGMGTVYVAYDGELARRVAIKVLRPDATGEEARARLLREAQTMAQLTHPNVLSVYDVGPYGDAVFIAMEYVEGRTLKSWMNEPHEWRDALAILVAAGRGLEAAHAAGIVHRDFKPENVLLGNDGRVVVGDFGIARAGAPGEEGAAKSTAPASRPEGEASAPTSARTNAPASGPVSGPVSARPLLSSPLTRSDAVIGTVGYMAPEQAFERRDDPRSDQFSFCVTLYRAVYGQPPFLYEDLATYLTSLLQPPRPPPAGTRVPAWVHDVIRRGLAREPAARFASMTALLDALGRDPTRRRRAWLLAACGVALAGLTGLGWVEHRRSVREECGVGERLVAATWSPETRARVGAAIAATHVPLAGEFATRAQAALDAYAAEWARVHREASEATLLHGRESTATMRDRLACLEGERGELAALVDVLSRADAVVANHAIGAAYGLPIPRACLEPGAARAAAAEGSSESRARLASVRRGLAEAEADRMTGKLEDALDAATRALAEARAISNHQSEAELLLLVGACKRELEDDTVARATFEEALAAAEAAGNDSLAAIAAATISLEVGDSLADVREAERWLAIAKGIRARAGKDDRADAEVLEAELALESERGHPDQAFALREELIALLERFYGASHPRIAVAIANRAGDLVGMGRFELAIAEYRKAIAMQEALFGPDAPPLSIYYNNVGSTLSELGRYDEAKEALDRALSLVAPLGPSNPHNVLPLVTMATLENRIGDRGAALAAATRGIAIIEATGDSEVRFFPGLLVQQGIAELAKGDAEAARAACARSLEVEEKQEVLGPDKMLPDAEDARRGRVTVLQAVENGAVDAVLALVLLAGGVVGAQLGTRFGTRLRGEQLRALLAILVLAVAAKLAFDLTVRPDDPYSLEMPGE